MRPLLRTSAAVVLATLPLASYAALREPPAAAVPAAAAQQDSLAAHRQQAVARVLERIRGREEEPAEEVFENIRVLRGIPAGRLVRIMDVGFGGSLGVACGHCHVRGDAASDDKPEKQIARAMWTMTRTINQELLPAIPDLKSENPTVNCTTCHRGQVKPATNLQPVPQAPPAGR